MASIEPNKIIECAICRSEMQESESSARIKCDPKCQQSNKIHAACLERWINTTNKCPMCRTPNPLGKVEMIPRVFDGHDVPPQVEEIPRSRLSIKKLLLIGTANAICIGGAVCALSSIDIDKGLLSTVVSTITKIGVATLLGVGSSLFAYPRYRNFIERQELPGVNVGPVATADPELLRNYQRRRNGEVVETETVFVERSYWNGEVFETHFRIENGPILGR